MATLIAPIQTSAKEDAELVNKAVKGWGYDEKTLIKILGHRNAYQRQQLKQAYEEMFNEDLVKRLESELSGDLEKAVYRWMLDPADRDALIANIAIKKGSPDYHVIIEIACVLSPEELLAVRKAYQIRYKRSLEEEVASNTSGDIRKLLVGLVTAYRYNGDDVDAKLADKEADILHDAIKNKNYTNEEVIRILSTRSRYQLLATFNRYRDEHGHSVSKALSSLRENDFINAMHTTIQCINDHKKYYQKVLRSSMEGFGTDEDALTRVIVTRAEKDLKDIKELYFRKNSVSLDHDVAKDTSGDYEAFLLTLLGKED
ncbi:annexin-like protein RJ4 isoform X1 [Tripterygium wilfordii]|uniref:annexin-like protein RJ4 isoform X1 n=2 Tax=Tripterygium wilfordii TaxID=458696 RepID=UPI0018F80CE5|nr:annexin-like protein RJ4 isoform X1 [Tripterygium wilfordii]